MVFKPIPVSQFRINARHVAELMWGTGGTQEDPERREAHEKAIKETFERWCSEKATA